MSQTVWVNNNGEWKQIESNVRDVWTTLSDKELAIIQGDKKAEQFVSSYTGMQTKKACKAYTR